MVGATLPEVTFRVRYSVLQMINLTLQAVLLVAPRVESSSLD